MYPKKLHKKATLLDLILTPPKSSIFLQLTVCVLNTDFTHEDQFTCHESQPVKTVRLLWKKFLMSQGYKIKAETPWELWDMTHAQCN